MKKGGYVLILVIPAISILIAIFSGRYAIAPSDMLNTILLKVGLGGGIVPPPTELQNVFWQIRIPRILLDFSVGAALAVAGTVLQALFRNPLASPDLLGVTKGASFGAVLALMYFPPLSIFVRLSAFLFGILAVFCANVLAAKSRDRSTAVLVLGGIIVSAVFEAGISLMQYLADPFNQLAQIVFWLMGSMQNANWDLVRSVLLVTVACTALLVVFSWRLNIMSQDDEQAISLGVDIRKWRVVYITLTTIMVAFSVSVCGDIKWVGLIVPHIARYFVGSEHKRLVPATAIIGGSMMLVMDTLARSLLSSEIPISIVTSLLGAPFLGYLVLRQRKGWAGK